MLLQDRVIVVAGAGGGLGTALLARLAAERPAGLCAGDLGPIDPPADAEVDYLKTDVQDSAQVDALVDRAVERFGRVDVMINNAGILSPNGRIHNLSLDDWQAVIDVNFYGALNGVRSAIRVMRPARAGSIVNTASVAGMTAWPYTGPYGVSKAAIIQLTKIAAVEYARDGIRVNCVCPGTFPTAIHRAMSQETLDGLAAKHPLGLGSPADLAGAYVYLASDEARWTTGTALVVDGGYAAL